MAHQSICSSPDLHGVLFLDWIFSVASVSPQRTSATLSLTYPTLQPGSPSDQKALLQAASKTDGVFRVTLIGLAVDTVSASNPAEETYREEDFGKEVRTEWTESGLKVYFTKVVPPKAVMRLRIDRF